MTKFTVGRLPMGDAVSMPPPNPITRLEQVALGLGELIDALIEDFGEPPINLRYWQSEIRAAIADLQRLTGDPG